MIDLIYIRSIDKQSKRLQVKFSMVRGFIFVSFPICSIKKIKHGFLAIYNTFMINHKADMLLVLIKSKTNFFYSFSMYLLVLVSCG